MPVTTTSEGADENVPDRIRRRGDHETPTGPTQRRNGTRYDDRADEKQRSMHHERAVVHHRGDPEIADEVVDVAVAGGLRGSDRLAYQVHSRAGQPDDSCRAHPLHTNSQHGRRSPEYAANIHRIADIRISPSAVAPLREVGPPARGLRRTSVAATPLDPFPTCLPTVALREQISCSPLAGKLLTPAKIAKCHHRQRNAYEALRSLLAYPQANRFDWAVNALRIQLAQRSRVCRIGGGAVTATIAQFLHASERIDTADQATFNGFNGLHGGLAVAMLVREMRVVVAPDKELVSVTARFIRPLVWPIVLDAEVVRNGQTLTVARAAASSHSGKSVEATATFGNGMLRDGPTFASEMPSEIAALSEAAPFTPPAEFIPISRRMKIRSATTELPYSGSTRPVLCGWVRLTDEVSSNEERISILIDCLAPS